MKKGLLFCLIVFCFCLTACQKSMIGEYELIQMENGEDILTQYDLKSYGIIFKLTINGDKTAVLKEGTGTTSLTYDDDKFIGVDEMTKEKREMKYTFDGSQIILDDSGDKMYFQKKK